MATVGSRPRAGWGTLTREQVVNAATRVVRAGQYDQLSIRRLAAELEVSPMALYRHVRDKDDLLGEIVDRMLARRWRPRDDRVDWRVWTKEAAERFRRFLVSEPAALHVYLQHPVVSPSAIARMASMLEVFEGAGLDESDAQAAYAAIHTYTIGFAAVEASRARAENKDGARSELERHLESFTTPQRFSQGLDYLLEGIDRRR